MNGGFSKLSVFVGTACDFAAVSSATNFGKILLKSGCTHVEGLRKKDFESSRDLGESSKALSSAVRYFVKYWWNRLGRKDARALAEARRAEELKKMEVAASIPTAMPPAAISKPSEKKADADASISKEAGDASTRAAAAPAGPAGGSEVDAEA